MNANFPAIGHDLWSLAGWTMIHFLWLGAIVAAFAFAGRLILRHAAPNLRYTFALFCLILITVMPIAAAWLYEPSSPEQVRHAFEPSPSGRGQGEGALLMSANPISPSSTDTKIPSPTPSIIELHTPSSDVATTADANSPRLNGGAGGGISNNASQPSTRNPQPSTISLLAPHSSLLSAAIPYLPWLWLIGTPLTFALLFTGLIGTRRLSRASTPITNGPIADALARLTTSLHITRRVTVAVCERVAAPVLIGIVRPMILLPPTVLTGWSPDEIEMVLLHELAHIRRYDNVVNLAQRIIESLLFFHPAVWLISTWIRREREACCDSAVVTRTQQPHAYAELLLNIASHLSEPGRPRRTSEVNDDSEPGRPRPRPFPLRRGRGRPGSLPVSSPMAAGPLRTRIRHILQLEDDPMLVTPKSLAITLATLLAAATLAFVYLPKIGQAEPSATESTENTEKKQEKGEAKSTKESLPEANVMPFSFVLKRDKFGDVQLYMNGHTSPVSDDLIRDSIKNAEKVIDKLQVSLSAEKGVRYADVMKTIDRLESLGIKKLALDTRALEMENQANVAPSPKDIKASGTLDRNDWPRGFAFPSPKEGEISKRAWKLFHVKILPATDEELQQVVHRGKRGGLKLVEFKEFPHFEEPFILTDIGSKPISRGIATFDDLAKVLDTLESQPAGSDDIIGLNGEAKNGHFQYNLRLPSSANAKAATKFPSLEDQKLADLAWKRLGLELEPIAADDLQRVKALGYDGGLRVVAQPGAVAMIRQNEAGGILFGGDILVGLHVWPTTNLKDIGTILNRDDLAELNPLKFYVVRRVPEQMGGGPTDPGKDTVVSGRLNVQLPGNPDTSRNRRDNGPASTTTPTRNAPTPWPAAVQSTPYQGTPNRYDVGPSTATPTPSDQNLPPLRSVLINPSIAEATPPLAPRSSPLAPQTLRYDGKPFEEWRNVWKTELSTEKRIETVKALAAFGRAGYGPEATAAILDVAGEYDFFMRDDSPEGRLKHTVLAELAPDYEAQTLAPHWVPDLAARLRQEPKKVKWLACNLLDRLRTDDKALLKIVQSLASVDDNGIRGSVIGAVVRGARANKEGLDESTRKLIDQSLESKDSEMVLIALGSMVSYPPPGNAMDSQPLLPYQPPALPKLLFHADEQVRRLARGRLSLLDDKATTNLVDQLIAILKDPSRQRDHIEAIRAIRAVGKRAAKATPVLAEILKSSDDQVTLAATTVALARVAGNRSENVIASSFQPQVVKHTLGIELTNDEIHALQVKISGEDGANQSEFHNRLQQEEQQVPSLNSTNLGGGGVF